MVSVVSLLLVAVVLSCGQTPFTKLVEVTFEATVPAGRSGGVFVSGDAPELGAWRASAVPLTAGSDGKYRASVRLAAGVTILFKATRGEWSAEETTADGSPIENRTFKVPSDVDSAVVSFTVVAWRDETRRPVGLDTGRIRVHEKFRATRLGNERRLFVLLPPSYAESPRRRYPVIYAHDGQNMFASVTGGARWDWNVDTVLDRLAASGLPEAIVVGVPSTDIRMEEYDPLARGADYADFLIREVKPFIDRTYRTKPDRLHTTTMGSSMGGLISSYLALRHSDVFSRAACLSIHVIHPMQDPAASGAWVRAIEAGVPKHQPVRLYVDRGTAGLDGRYGPLFDRLVGALERGGFARGKSLDAVVTEGADHNEAAWAARVDRPLRFLLGP